MGVQGLNKVYLEAESRVLVWWIERKLHEKVAR